jgi:hypothetical protein
MAKLKYYATTAPRFSRQWWFASARTFLWIVVVSVLIWVYADIEFTEVRDVRIKVRLFTAQHKTVMLKERGEVELTVKARGNRTGLDRLRHWVESRGSLIEYDPSDVHALGKRSIPTAPILEKIPQEATRGLTIVSCEPGQAPIELVSAPREPVPVEFVSRGTTPPSWTAEPNRVSVRATKEQWQEIRASAGDRELHIQTRAVDLSASATGRSLKLNVEVLPFIEDVPVEVSPSTVAVTVEVKARTDEANLPVRVRVLSPPIWGADGTWEKYSLKSRDDKEWEKTIVVRGPKQDIEKLKGEKDKIDAYIVLTEADKEKLETFTDHPVIVRFPEDVQVQLIQILPNPKVGFRLEKKTPSPPGT